MENITHVNFSSAITKDPDDETQDVLDPCLLFEGLPNEIKWREGECIIRFLTFDTQISIERNAFLSKLYHIDDYVLKIGSTRLKRTELKMQIITPVILDNLGGSEFP